ncbi:hypothetical protein DM02DRAFT_240098 [Periconia macrospinosa]|uniref:Uncharacterized protein n=1 Tax=Periconia macrospinosa TaxID=97972 RepID=A0A2V1E337_9PLEO|nr:hypothetical protein DM02DRAFT_240098 [Periconia macrospinosa]
MRPGTSNHGWLQEGIIRGNMLAKVLPGDEELGKKDDDYHRGSTSRTHRWTPTRTSPLRWRRRRILVAILGLCLFYVLVKNFPDWLLEQPYDLRGVIPPPPIGNGYGATGGVEDEEPSGAPPGTTPPKPGEVAPHTYSGQIRFYRLSPTLHGAGHTNGYRSNNRNVVFAISNLQSAAKLLPVICEMSRWSRSWVHAAFMGREDIDTNKILEINGIDTLNCPAIWHDARPDYSEYSTDERAESSVISAMGHIHSFLHPQAVIIDDPLSEDGFFVRGVRAKTDAIGMTLIEGPENWDNSMWTTRLDAGSLKSWHDPSVEIIIQVPPRSSSIIQLLKSIKGADYAGLNYPHLTIELPAEVDEFVSHYISEFQWPPNGERNRLSLKRKVTRERATQESSAIRFLELFYPSSTSHSHALLLSPQVELSPHYYQYIMYQILEYKYSAYGAIDSSNVMGVSMELPATLLDGESKLVLPKPKDMHTERYEERFPDTPSVPFLWEAPNSHATLFFGDKWAEFHSFVSNRVAKHLQTPKTPAQKKVVSETLPSWTEYMLEFMRVRGYTLIYPGAKATETLVTVHNELYHAPEEYLELARGGSDDIKQTDDSFVRTKGPVAPVKYTELAVIPRSRPLHEALPFRADLPEIVQMPYLLFNGEQLPHANATTAAEKYAGRFREVIGGCKIPQGVRRKVVPGSARDLFCFGDETEDDWLKDIVDPFERFPESDALAAAEDYAEKDKTTRISSTPAAGSPAPGV